MTNIEASFQAAIAAKKINGAVICARNKDGTFIYDKAIGERTLLTGEKRPQQLNDVLYLASATKIITTIAALQYLVDIVGGATEQTGNCPSCGNKSLAFACWRCPEPRPGR